MNHDERIIRLEATGAFGDEATFVARFPMGVEVFERGLPEPLTNNDRARWRLGVTRGGRTVSQSVRNIDAPLASTIRNVLEREFCTFDDTSYGAAASLLVELACGVFVHASKRRGPLDYHYGFSYEIPYESSFFRALIPKEKLELLCHADVAAFVACAHVRREREFRSAAARAKHVAKGGSDYSLRKVIFHAGGVDDALFRGLIEAQWTTIVRFGQYLPPEDILASVST